VAFCCSGCQFPYKIDPSGNCLFVKNEDATLPEFSSPFTSTQGLRPNEPATVPASPAPGYQSSIPGVNVAPGTASGVAPSASGVIGGGTTRSTSTMLVPGSGPIVLVAPDEQIALIGSEVILFANYKGDDDYLRIGERIEWSLGGVGHIQTTNKTQCSNILALDFNKDKKLSDRFAVTSTLHYEGTIDRGSSGGIQTNTPGNTDEQGKIPHLAGQSWISIQSAEEGTSTVTAFAPTIKDWNRRTSSATVHWIDAEWIYPRPDITKYDEPKIFMTQVKKRSSGLPCQNWVVRYEVIGGPNAGFGPNSSKVVEVPTDGNGEAAVELYLREGSSGISTVKATIIRPAGVDGGTKRLELHSSTVTNNWSADAPLSITTDPPSQMRWGERSNWAINVANRSSVTKSGVVTLQLPGHIKWISSVPTPSSKVPQADGGELLSWDLEFPGMLKSQIQLVLQAVTNDPALSSQPLHVELVPKLSMFPRESGQGNRTDGGSSGNAYNPPPQTYATPDNNFPINTAPPFNGGFPPGGGYDGMGGTEVNPTTPPIPGGNDPAVFAGKLRVECKVPAAMTVDDPKLITVDVTNNATTPFFEGLVYVDLEDGLGFVDTRIMKYLRDDHGNVLTAQEFRMTDDNQQETAISPDQKRTISLYVAPTRVGQRNITATVYGQTQDGQWQAINGATDTRSTRAMEE